MKRWLKWTLVASGSLLILSVLTLLTLWSVWRLEFDAEVRTLEATGAPIHPAALAPPSVPDADNAALPILAAAQILKALPADEDPDWDLLSSGAQTDLQPLELWVGKRAGYYARMAEAVARPQCRFPINYDQGIWGENPAVSGLLPCGRASGLRAILSLRKGTGSAIPDLQAMIRLRDSLSGEPFLLSQLVRYALHELVMDLLKGKSLHLTPEEWSGLAAAIGGSSFEADYGRAMEMERASAIQFCRRDLFWGQLATGPGATPQYYRWMIPFAPRMGTQYLRSLNAVVDCAKKPYPLSHDAESTLTLEAQQERSWDKALGALLTPAFLRTHQSMANALAAQAQAAAYCRIRAAGKAPEFLEIPDPFTGKPMRYEKLVDGFKLWSVGANLTDDDGEDDDIVFRGKP